MKQLCHILSLNQLQGSTTADDSISINNLGK